jgi:hypothetical protein
VPHLFKIDPAHRARPAGIIKFASEARSSPAIRGKDVLTGPPTEEKFRCGASDTKSPPVSGANLAFYKRAKKCVRFVAANLAFSTRRSAEQRLRAIGRKDQFCLELRIASRTRAEPKRIGIPLAF